jgi:hypothetical protein
MMEDQKVIKKQNFVVEKVNDAVSRMGIVGELLGFLWRAKMWWLIPMVVALLAFAVILIFATSTGAPMIYTLF